MTAHPIDTEALRRLAEDAVIDVQGADRCQALGIMPAAYQLHRRLRETARALPALLDENAALRARIQVVRELHTPFEDKDCGTVCAECSYFGGEYGLYPIDYPCDTIRALDGSVPPPAA